METNNLDVVVNFSLIFQRWMRLRDYLCSGSLHSSRISQNAPETRNIPRGEGGAERFILTHLESVVTLRGQIELIQREGGYSSLLHSLSCELELQKCEIEKFLSHVRSGNMSLEIQQ